MERLSEFIRNNIDRILNEWEGFAHSLPVATEQKLSRSILRDHSREILLAIIKDIESRQTAAEQKAKSLGEAAKNSDLAESPAEIHGALRSENGFNIMEMVSEYRALRASVTRLWVAEFNEFGTYQLHELIRFNESIDQALAESTLSFTNNLEMSKDLFIGIIGHDLRNPLGAISLSAEFLQSRSPLNEKQQKLVGQIGESAARIDKIITDLLDLTRARLTGTLPVDKQPMDLGQTTRKIIDEMQALHPGRRMVLECVGNLDMQGDGARIEQLLSNLLGNALQYGAADAVITVIAKNLPDKLVLAVHNTGEPIPAAAIPLLFEAMVRGTVSAEPIRTVSNNLGLGLYIAKMIVQAHGGKLTVASTQLAGTVFTATFPRL